MEVGRCHEAGAVQEMAVPGQGGGSLNKEKSGWAQHIFQSSCQKIC